MVKVGIVGATGYTGSELLRLLIQHPQVDIAVVTSRTETGKQVSELYPALRGYTDICFSDPATAPLAECEIVFFAAPKGTAMRQVPALLEAGVRVIDLSGDFRLKDANVWSQWYGEAHCAETLLSDAVYGLPELHRGRIAAARLVANPGCYSTAIILGLLPLFQAGIIQKDSIIADAKSGISGSGRKAEANLLLAENADSFRAYAVAGHRHLPEITQELGGISKGDICITFVPHILPIIRGIHATIYAQLEQKTDIQEIFAQQYKDEYFVDVLPPGTHPETRSVRCSNFCRIAVHETANQRTVVILSVIDNLVKGAAGQAIQNMNIMLGFDEKAGLDRPGMMP